MFTTRPSLLHTLAAVAAVIGSSAQLVAIDRIAQTRSMASTVVELPRVVVTGQRLAAQPALARQARGEVSQPG